MVTYNPRWIEPTNKPWIFGLGNVVSPGQAQIAGIAATGAATTGALLAIFNPATMSIAGPIGAAVGALIGVGVGIANMFSGCGDTCTETSNAANQAQALLDQNAAAYFATPTPRPRSIQQAALNNVDTIFAALNKMCSDPAMGSAGVACISQRLVRGNPAPWCPNPGNVGCDWVTAYRDPIANDKNVGPDPVVPSAANVDSVLGVPVNIPSTVAGLPIVPLVLAAIGILFFSGD